MGGAWAELKILSKNTSEGVHLIVKLPAISLQASKFTKNELLHTYFFSKDFKAPHGRASFFVGGERISKKIVRFWDAPHEHYGKPCMA